jgi:hypothetical protein
MLSVGVVKSLNLEKLFNIKYSRVLQLGNNVANEVWVLILAPAQSLTKFAKFTFLNGEIILSPQLYGIYFVLFPKVLIFGANISVKL